MGEIRKSQSFYSRDVREGERYMQKARGNRNPRGNTHLDGA
jgi:hypothetical protein